MEGSALLEAWLVERPSGIRLPTTLWRGWVGICGGGGVDLRGTSAPRTASRPLRIPAWRSTSAGTCPGRKRQHKLSG